MTAPSVHPLTPERYEPKDATPRSVAALVRKYWPLALAAALVGALLGYGVSQLSTPRYTAKSTLYFSIGFGASGTDLNQGASYAQSQMLSFAELARSQRVLQPVVDSLDLDVTAAELAESLDVATPPDTVVLNIEATSTEASEAAAIANGVAESLTEAVNDVAPRDSDDRQTVEVRTVETAEAPTAASSPNPRLNVLAGALIGVIASLLFIAARRALDTRVRDDAAVASAGAGPVLARLHVDAGDALAFDKDPDSATAEDYRRLLATLDAAGEPHRSAARAQVWVVAPVVEGARDARGNGTASAVASNLARAAHEAEQIVATLTDATPADLDAELTADHDIVFVAPADVAAGSRSLRLGRAADGLVLLADQRTIHVDQLRSSVEQLRQAGVHVVGTVLIGLPNVVGAHRRGDRGRVQQPLPVLKHNDA